MNMTGPNHKICLMLDKDAEAEARFYTQTFPESAMGRVQLAPSDNRSGNAGAVLVVEFTLLGMPCIGVNGGVHFQHSEAFSFQVTTKY